MKCRKCNGKTTRRRAGVFFCQHCGMQPGTAQMDRFGTPAPTIEHPQAQPTPEDMIIRPYQGKLRGAIA